MDGSEAAAEGLGPLLGKSRLFSFGGMTGLVANKRLIGIGDGEDALAVFSGLRLRLVPQVSGFCLLRGLFGGDDMFIAEAAGFVKFLA